MKLINLVYLFFLFVLTACNKDNALDCFKSKGSEKTETRLLDNFTYIKTYDKIDVTIVKGTDYKVDITTGNHLLKNIKTTVSNGVLTIKNSNKCNFVRGYKIKITITVTLPYLNRIENLGVGTVYFDKNYTQDNLSTRCNSSGDIYIDGAYTKITSSSHGDGNVYATGTCDTLFVYMNGTNFFKAQGLTINKYVFVENISLTNAYINAPVNGPLECNIRSEGNIYYSGTPLYINDYSNGEAKGKLIKE